MPRTGNVCMFVLNPLVNDTRVEKQAATLAAADYEVRIVAALRPGLPMVERRAGAAVVRVDDDPLPAKLARAVIRRQRQGHAAQGTVITREAAEAPGLRGRLMRKVLAWHLWLAWRRYLRKAYGAAAGGRSADVWIAHDLDTLPVAMRAARRRGGRVLYDSHELFIDSGMGANRRRSWERLERRLIGRADAVTTVSPSIADLLARRYGIERPEVILNVPEATAGDSDRPVDLAVEAGLKPDTRIAIYVGGIQQDRGLEQLVEAVRGVEELAAVMLGPVSAAYKAQLERLAENAGVAERVRLLPPVSPGEIVRWVAAADVGIVATQGGYLNHYHSMPNKLFDYLHAGLPLVVSDFPDMRELVERHDVGVTCDPSSPSAIAAAIASVLADPDRYAELRANARRAAPLYTWEREGEKLLRIVAGLARASSTQPAEPAAASRCM